MVRAMAETVNPRAVGCKICPEIPVNCVDILRPVEAACNAGLVGDDKRQETGLIDQADGFDGAGQPTEF